MKIVLVHNFYQQPGGEDQVFADETALLEANGHQVVRHTVHNDNVTDTTKLTLAGKTIWNRSAHAELHKLVRREKADITHFHNTFPLLSPAVYHAARSAGAAVVQTLHNYRFLCPSAIFFRDGHVCEDCLGKPIAWPSVVHSCYRSDRGATAVSATMLAVHRARGTYENEVDAYITLTEFAKSKFVIGGLPANRLFMKPNFVSPDPGIGTGSGGYALFAGRLTQSKGVRVLLDAWKKLKDPISLKILGDGDLAPLVRQASAGDPRIEWLGQKPSAEVYRIMGEAAALIFPSLWYEGLPKTIIESFAKGTPVIASRLGSMIELIADGKTGLHFTADDSNNLADAVQQYFSDPAKMQQMRKLARLAFESQYTPEENYQRLLQIYQTARHHFAAADIGDRHAIAMKSESVKTNVRANDTAQIPVTTNL